MIQRFLVSGCPPGASFYWCGNSYRQGDTLECDPDADPADQVAALLHNSDSLLARKVVEQVADAKPKGAAKAEKE